jgi:hypothetical protein
MRIRIRPPRLTYSNVMVSLLAFVVLGGGVAWAHGKIGTKDLRNQAVTTPKVSGGAISQAKLRGKVRPRWAVVNANGALARGRLAASASRIANPGAYAVIFRNNVRGCSYVATPEGAVSPNEQPATTSVRTLRGDPRGVQVRVFALEGAGPGQRSTLVNRAFHLQVEC